MDDSSTYDKGSKIIIIYKGYENIKQLLKLVKEREKKENTEYIYDKELNKYIF